MYGGQKPYSNMDPPGSQSEDDPNVQHSRSVIAYVWVASLVCTAVLFVGSFAAAVYNDTSPNGFSGGGFAIMWLTLLMVAYSVYGTLFFRRRREALSFGFFLGVTFMFCNMLLTVFTLFCGLSQEDDGDAHHADALVAAFCFFQMLNYVALVLILWFYRKPARLYEEPKGDNRSFLEKRKPNSPVKNPI